jgi:hypothetical protein
MTMILADDDVVDEFMKKLTERNSCRGKSIRRKARDREKTARLILKKEMERALKEMDLKEITERTQREIAQLQEARKNAEFEEKKAATSAAEKEDGAAGPAAAEEEGDDEGGGSESEGEGGGDLEWTRWNPIPPWPAVFSTLRIPRTRDFAHLPAAHDIFQGWQASYGRCITAEGLKLLWSPTTS